MLLLVSTEKLSKIRGEIPGGFNSIELSFFCMLYPLLVLFWHTLLQRRKNLQEIFIKLLEYKLCFEFTI